MNERIFELAKQADLIQWDSLPSGARTPDHKSVVKARKFAELIVAECTDLVQKYMTRWPKDHELTKQIKQHFGVKE